MTRITEGRAREREREREFLKNYGIRYIIVSSCLALKQNPPWSYLFVEK
jgi:hypothetical protein